MTTYEGSARMHIDYLNRELLDELEAEHARRQDQNRRAVQWWRRTGTRTERPVKVRRHA